jgi:hypothetical protein
MGVAEKIAVNILILVGTPIIKIVSLTAKNIIAQ